MSYQSVWWHPNYVEYGSGLNTPKTWPNVMEQYRRPHPLHTYGLRYYDLPTEEYEAKLYYRLPRLGQPTYRGLFRDKPHTLPDYYPEGNREGKPKGFYGRMYYEDGPPTFKYEGPKHDKCYWLERPPYLPSFTDPREAQKRDGSQTGRGINLQRQTEYPGRSTGNFERTLSPSSQRLMTKFEPKPPSNPTKRMTQDGAGYL